MIFGFNTDIKYGDTVYHVQSEVREHDKLLQTQVFVKGRCLGKYAISFAADAGQNDWNEDRLHDLLKAQHKRFVECAREGTIEQEIESDHGVPSAAPPAAASATSAFMTPAPAPPPPAAIDPVAAFLGPESASAPVFSVTPPAEEPPEPEEQRIALSLSDDPDLAVLAEASAAAIIENENVTPPRALVRVDEVPEETVARPPDPVLDSFMAELEAAEHEPPPPPLPQFRVEPAGSVMGKGIGLDCLEPIVAPDGSNVLLNVQVSDEGNASPQAQITCRVAAKNGPAAYVYSTSNANGVADLRITTQGLDVSTGILIQATVRGKSASRKFTLKRA